MGSQAMNELTAQHVFECVKVAFSQDKNGYVLKLSIHPNDIPDDVITDPLGTRYKIGLIREDEQDNPTERRAVQAAGLLCRNPLFAIYLRSRHGSVHAVDEASTASALRDLLGCNSRSEIAGQSARRMMEIASDFREWSKSNGGHKEVASEWEL
jgi:hypothetical protein